jgi:hypothetical protein
MQKMLLLREVAKFAKEIERSANYQLEKTPTGQSVTTNQNSTQATPTPTSPPVPTGTFGYSPGSLHGLAFAAHNEDASSKRSADTTNKTIIDTDARDPLTGSLQESEQIKILQLLEQWEEPERQAGRAIVS